jgi:hypothetical protein
VVFKPNFRISANSIRKLLQIEELKITVEKLPIMQSLLNSLRETALLNSTHFSTQIEGNLLALPEVAAVKAGRKFPSASVTNMRCAITSPPSLSRKIWRMLGKRIE